MSERANQQLAWVAFGFFCLLAYAAIERGSSMAILVVLALFGLMILSWRPWLPFALTAVTVAAVIAVQSYPSVTLGGTRIWLPEALILMGMAAGVLRAGRDGSFAEIALSGPGGPLLVFFGAVFLGLAVGVANGAGLKEGINGGARAMLYYGVYFLAVAAMYERRTRRVTFGIIMALAVTVSVVAVIQAIIGVDHPLVFGSRLSGLVQIDQDTGATRVRPPGLTLIYAVVCFAACYLIWGPSRHRRLATFVLMCCVAGVLVSLNRNMFLGVPFGLGVAALAARAKSRVVVIFAVIAIIVPLLLAAAGLALQAAGSSPQSNPFVARALSLGNVQQLETGTLQTRFYENAKFWKAIRLHPVLGLGWGPSYGATQLVPQGTNNYVEIDRPWIHNQYYYFWLRTGVIGIVSLMLVFVIAGVLAVRWFRDEAFTDEGWLGAGVLAAGSSLLLSATVGMYLSDPPSVVAVTVILGIAGVLNIEMRHASEGAAPVLAVASSNAEHPIRP